MSLVAYAASSDEESDNEDDNQTPPPCTSTSSNNSKGSTSNSIKGHISDDDEDYEPTISSLQDTSHHKPMSLSLSLPKPKNHMTTVSGEVDDTVTPIFAKLPMPRGTQKVNDKIEEDDDEFLHKKATSLPGTELQKPPPAPTITTKGTVKITIPSMKDFADVDEDIARSGKQQVAQAAKRETKKSGLLAVLPKAKSEQNFAKSEGKKPIENIPSTSTSTFKDKPSSTLIPDTVRNRRPATNTEGIDGVMTVSTQKVAPPKAASLVNCSDSEASDDDAADFFSLNDDNKLPEVNANELSVMVAKRAAKMADATKEYLKSNAVKASEDIEEQSEELQRAQKRYHEAQLNEEALHALVGSKSKRRRQQSKIEIVEISGNQVLPDRDEWMRTALASSTSYQPTGVLVDEEPASGTRRKHQITYLAHKAKANEAELQAMWAANRQNRRATQSKYGF